MRHRDELFERALELRGLLQVLPQSDPTFPVLLQELHELSGDLDRLSGTPFGRDTSEELYMLFLARCRLMRLGDYRITAFVGAGRCGTVFRGENLQNSELSPAAIKILFVPRDEEESFRFTQEASVLQRLSHPNIVKGLTRADRIEFLPVTWYAMELVYPAMSLRKKLESINLSIMLQLLSSVAAALQHAHDRGIVHRDLHFDNVLVTEAGVPKVLDFGSAKYAIEAHTFRPVGNLRGASPEKLLDPAVVNAATDVFSMGSMVYFCLTGRWPFHGSSYGDLLRKLEAFQLDPPADADPSLRDLVMSMLARAPVARPTAGFVSQELSRLAPTLASAPICSS